MSATARLSSDGTRVLCCMIDCGVTLAWIMEPNEQMLERERFVWFPPGWCWQRDGTWTVSARARRRLRRGQTPQAESVIAGVRPVEGPAGWVPYLPTMAHCPACGMRQRLDAEVLGVRSVTDARVHRPCGWPGCPDFATSENRGGLLMQRPFCPKHEQEYDGQRDGGYGDRHDGGFVRVLVSRDELQRWERAPLRFQ